MIKVAITDDHKLFRVGIRYLIDEMNDIELVLETSGGQELLDRLEGMDVKPDVLLLDLDMPGMDGVQTLKILRSQYPELGVIILTNYSDPKMMVYLMELGANGYLLKDTDPETLQRAIESVYREGYFFTRGMSKATLTGQPKQIKNPFEKSDVTVTQRELEVLELICQEMTAKERVEGHQLDHETVEKHRKLLLQKFRAQLHGTKTENS